jgi:hypothetical protein
VRGRRPWGYAPSRLDSRGGCRAATLTATATYEPGYNRPAMDCFCTLRTCADGAGRDGQNLQAGGRWFEPNRAHCVYCAFGAAGGSHPAPPMAATRPLAWLRRPAHLLPRRLRCPLRLCWTDRHLDVRTGPRQLRRSRSPAAAGRRWLTTVVGGSSFACNQKATVIRRVPPVRGSRSPARCCCGSPCASRWRCLSSPAASGGCSASSTPSSGVRRPELGRCWPSPGRQTLTRIDQY